MSATVPAMTEATALDTTIHEPSLTAGEAEMLMFALDRSRAQFAWKAGGLDADALRAPHPPSDMTMAGLIKHLARVEDEKVSDAITGEPLSPPWESAKFEADPDWDWHSALNDSPDELYALWRAAVERSRAAWSAAIDRGGLDQPAKFTLPSGERPNLRRFLVDLQDEYARHVGHADLFREAIDGLVGEDPPQRK